MGFELDKLMKQYGVGSAAIAPYSPPTGGAPAEPSALRPKPEKPTGTTTPNPGMGPGGIGSSGNNYQQDLKKWEEEKKKYDADMAKYREALAKYNTEGAAYNAGKPAYDAYVAEYNRRVQNTPMYNQAQFNYGKNVTPTWADQLAPFTVGSGVGGSTGGTGGGTTPGGTNPGGGTTAPGGIAGSGQIVNFMPDANKPLPELTVPEGGASYMDVLAEMRKNNAVGSVMKNNAYDFQAMANYANKPVVGSDNKVYFPNQTTPPATTPPASTPPAATTSPAVTAPTYLDADQARAALKAKGYNVFDKFMTPTTVMGMAGAGRVMDWNRVAAEIGSPIRINGKTYGSTGFAKGGEVEALSVERPDVEVVPRPLEEMAAAYGEGESPDELAKMIEILQAKKYAENEDAFQKYLGDAERAAAEEKLAIAEQDYYDNPPEPQYEDISDEEYRDMMIKMYGDRAALREQRLNSPDVVGGELLQQVSPESIPEDVYLPEYDVPPTEEYMIDAAGKRDTVQNPFVKNTATTTAPEPQVAATTAPAETLDPTFTTPNMEQLQSMLSRYMPQGDGYARETAAARARVKAESDAFETLLKQAIASPDDAASNKAEMYFRLAAAFGSPTKTGNFFENLALAGKEMGEVEKGKRETGMARRKLLLEGQKLKLDAAKDELTTLRTLTAEEMKDKRAIAQAMIKSYIDSGQPQSAAGKQARDEGLTPGTPAYQKRVSEIGSQMVDKQMAAITASLAAAEAARGNLAVNQQRLEAQQKKDEREAKKLSPAEIKMKAESEDVIANSKQALADLKEAYRLNPNTLGGSLLDKAQQAIYEAAGSKDPVVVNTRILNNLLGAQGLAKLRATFGGSPTEGERAILLELEGIGSKTKEERGVIIKRAYKALQDRLAREQKRLDDINSGAYRTAKPIDEEE